MAVFTEGTEIRFVESNGTAISFVTQSGTAISSVAGSSGGTSGGSGGTETGAYCGCCGATDNLIYIEGSGYVCESCHESWG